MKRSGRFFCGILIVLLLPGVGFAGNSPADRELLNELKSFRNEVKGLKQRLNELETAEKKKGVNKKVKDLDRRIKYLEATDQILEIATSHSGIEPELDIPSFILERDLLHPLRPYGVKKERKVPLHYHSPGRYCPICGELVAMDEEPPDMTGFQPGVTAGGSIRVRGELFKDFHPNVDGDPELDPTEGDKPDSGYIENRVENLIKFNLAAGITEHTVAFLQGQWEYYFGTEEEHDSENFKLYQGFIEYNQIGGLPFDLTVGRQELVYGDAFVVGANAFGNGSTFDMIKLDYTVPGVFRADLLAAKLEEVEGRHNHETGDDASDRDLFGIYTTTIPFKAGLSPFEGSKVDAYVFLVRQEEDSHGVRLRDRPGTVGIYPEERYIIGFRPFFNLGEYVGVEVEPIWEVGRIYNPDRKGYDRISSYGGHMDLYLTPPLPLNLNFIFAYAYGSGDRNSDDATDHLFRATEFHDSFMYGEIGIVGDASGTTLGALEFSGTHVISGGFSIDPVEYFNLNVDFHDFYADKTNKISGTGVDVSRHIGTELNIILSFDLPGDMNINFSYNPFFPGNGYKQAYLSSQVIHYYFLQTTASF